MGMASEPSPMKQISDRRRMQNKQAQKKYRERQRRNLKVLQEIVTSSHGFCINTAENNGYEIAPSVGNFPGLNMIHDSTPIRSYSSAFPEVDVVVGSSSESDQSLGKFFAGTQKVRSCSTAKLPLTPETPHENDIVSRLFEEERIYLDEKTKLLLLESPMTLQAILEAGLNALSHGTSSDVPSLTSQEAEASNNNGTRLRTDKLLVLKNASSEYTAPLPDLHRNHFRMKQVMYIAACMTNASSLGFDLRGEDCENYVESPFFRNDISEATAKTACLNEFTNLKSDLRPTATQMIHKHHPYIDVLPFPTFRDRIIKLACAEDPMVDEDELCEDLQNDGLVCWGSSLGGGSEAMGSGAPWDIRSWEAQPWFLKKWWILIGGAEGEIYKQSRWWCEMRGERFCNPW